MVKVTIYVEGADKGQPAVLFRKNMKTFLERVAGTNCRISVKACGSRRQAYEKFQHDREQGHGERSVILVDSEAPVEAVDPWQHLMREGKHWTHNGAPSDDCHLMVESQENWLCCDADALRAFYEGKSKGRKFKASALPVHTDMEKVPKEEACKALEQASRDCAKGSYRKRHAWEIIALIDPAKVRERCPTWAERFFSTVEGWE